MIDRKRWKTQRAGSNPGFSVFGPALIFASLICAAVAEARQRGSPARSHMSPGSGCNGPGAAAMARDRQRLGSLWEALRTALRWLGMLGSGEARGPAADGAAQARERQRTGTPGTARLPMGAAALGTGIRQRLLLGKRTGCGSHREARERLRTGPAAMTSGSPATAAQPHAMGSGTGKPGKLPGTGCARSAAWGAADRDRLGDRHAESNRHAMTQRSEPGTRIMVNAGLTRRRPG